ncbi:GNAT family N-acetyltransferase [Yoonia sp. R2331]|uniref:GNAT family N-acetyltransferase n=1 Tax=Yoonia sp. R2331 TaxID=3237238 RepID=UPI0034E5E9F0
MTPRAFSPDEISALASLWHDGWHEAHAAHVPAELTAQRTRESFVQRLPDMADRTRVIGPMGAPLGLCAIEGAELDQLFVARAGRGTGIAAALLQDGVNRLAANGVRRAHLYCLVGNDPAARFYARQGWEDMGQELMGPPATETPFALRCIRFEKSLDGLTSQD